MPEWVIAVLALGFTVLGTLFGFTLAQDRRITRLEERVRGIGRQLVEIPKRKGDHDGAHDGE